jgi:SAM-dependent methyltransferase
MLPLLLHAHYTQYQDDLEFWENLADDCAGPILELGCGTGRLLNQLAQFHPSVFGIDHGFDMLVFCKKTLTTNYRTRIHILQADFRSFHFAEKFGLILIACNTYSTLSEIKRLEVLSRVNYHLATGGKFAFSIPNPVRIQELDEQSETEVEAVFNHPIDNEPVQVLSSWELGGGKWTLFWHYEHLLPDGTVERTSAHTTHFLTHANQYAREIQNAGFRNMIFYGDFDNSQYTESSPYLISVSTK